MVTFLGPRIGEIQQHLGERVRGQLRGETLHRVVTQYADVRQAELGALEQQVSDARPMHLDPEEVVVRVQGRERQQVLAIAETDFERAVCVTTKPQVEIDDAAVELASVARPQRLPGTLLGDRHATAAHDEAAY